MKRKIGAIILGAICVVVSMAAVAFDTGRRDLTANVRLRQGMSVAYDLDRDGAALGPAQYLVEGKVAWQPGSNWTLIADLWLRGDWFPSFNNVESEGIQDFTDATTPPFFIRRFGFFLNETQDLVLPNPFGASANELRVLDDFSEITRELSVKYRDTKNRFTVKVGRMQRGWGQSDGLRLLDVLHAQDLRERFAFRDSDELRIPAFMVSADFNFDRMGIGKPFEALGMKRPTLEFMFIPEVFQSRFIINNPTPSDPSSGGIFGLPYPKIIDPKSGFGMPFLGTNLTMVRPKRFSFDEAEYGLRYKFGALGGDWTINAFYGQQDLPVVKFTGGNLIRGNFLGDEAHAVTLLSLPRDAAVGAIQGPGGYLDFLRSFAGFVGGGPPPIAFPLVPFDCIDITGVVAPGPTTVPCSLNANFDLDFRHRQKLLGFSFTRDIREFKFGRRQTTPVLRLEFGYEFDKAFNRSIATTPFGEVETGSPVLVLGDELVITESDVASVMVGFDYPLYLPFWETQKKSIFTSFQFFNIHTADADEGLLQQAPYAFATVPDNQNFVTFLWNMPVWNEKIVFEGLMIRDFDNSGWVYRQRLDLQVFGDRWRPRIEMMHFSGDRETAPAGLFAESDFVEFSLTYQF